MSGVPEQGLPDVLKLATEWRMRAQTSREIAEGESLLDRTVLRDRAAMLEQCAAELEQRAALERPRPALPRCEKCDSVHAEWLDVPYPHSIENPLPTNAGAGFKHKPDVDFILSAELNAEFKGRRWVVGYTAIEENPWGVHGPMDDGRDHVYPIAWLSTRRQAESVAYTLEAYAGAALPAEHAPPDTQLGIAIAHALRDAVFSEDGYEGGDALMWEVARRFGLRPAMVEHDESANCPLTGKHAFSECDSDLKNLVFEGGSRPALAGSPSTDEQQAAKIRELEARHDARDRSNEKDAP